MTTRSVSVVFACLLLFATAGAAPAADYPSKAIDLVVPWAAGGTSDLTARGLAKALEPILRQPVIVTNATGASGDDFAFLRLLLGRVRNDKPGSSGGLSLERLNEDTVLERLDRGCHVQTPFCCLGVTVQYERDVVAGAVPIVGTRACRVPRTTLDPRLALRQAECQS